MMASKFLVIIRIILKNFKLTNKIDEHSSNNVNFIRNLITNKKNNNLKLFRVDIEQRNNTMISYFIIFLIIKFY